MLSFFLYFFLRTAFLGKTFMVYCLYKEVIECAYF